MRHKALKITCGVAAILILALLITLLILIFTLFKPTDPKITTDSAELTDFRLIFWPSIQLNFSLGIGLTIDNRNYGSFRHENSTAYFDYRGRLVGEAPVGEDNIPARKKHSVYTKVTVFADRIVSDPKFEDDRKAGVLNFTSTTTLHGRIRLFKIFNKKATTHGRCVISVFLQNQTANADCKNKLAS